MSFIPSVSIMRAVFFACLFIVLIINSSRAGNTPDFNEILLAAEKGDPQSQYLLGALYNYGETVKQIKSIHYNGKPIRQNYKEAARWFQKAARQGHVSAQYLLGFQYELGKGVPKSRIEAIRWYGKAAKQGHKPSLSRMKAVISLEKFAVIRKVRDSINKIIPILGGHKTSVAEIDRDKRAAIHSILDGLFDFSEFSKCSLGNRQWQRFSSGQQQSFLDLHQKYIENGFIQLLMDYLRGKNKSEEKIDFQMKYGIKLNSNHFFSLKYRKDQTAYQNDTNRPVVFATLEQFGDDDFFTFHLFSEDGAWKVYDYRVSMTSLAEHQQLMFAPILLKNSPERLLELLQKEINKQNNSRDPGS